MTKLRLSSTLGPSLVMLWIGMCLCCVVPLTYSAYSGTVCGYIDVDKDLYTDLLVLDTTGLTIYLAETSSATFYPSQVYTVALPKAPPPEQIRNCAVADFNGDDYADIILSYAVKEKTDIHICFGTSEKKFNCTFGVSGALSQPTVGDFKMDYVGPETLAHINDFFFVNGTGMCFYGKKAQSFEPPELESQECFKADGFSYMNGFMNAFAGLDADNDLEANFLLGVEKDGNRKLQVWRKDEKPDEKWSIYKAIDLPKPNKTTVHGYMVIADIDADGRNELFIPIANCPSENKCTSLSFVLWSHRTGKNEFFTGIIPDIPLEDGHEVYIIPDGPEKGSFHVGVGDYTLDGYPDFLFMVNGKDKGSPRIFIIHNLPCTSDSCSLVKRKLSVDWNEHFLLPFGAGDILIKAAFFDLLEDGNLDLLCQFKNETGNYFSFLKSLDKGDTSFLKVQVFSTCGKDCANSVASGGSGIVAVGGTVYYESVDEFSEPIYGVYTQVSQSSYGALQLPYALFGLGRTPNFVDTMRVGMPAPVNKPLTKKWIQIIPNSRIYVIPYGPPDEWISKLYLTPNKVIIQSLAAFCSVCGVILILISILHWRERQQDKKEKQEAAHRFHFDAM